MSENADFEKMSEELRALRDEFPLAFSRPAPEVLDLRALASLLARLRPVAERAAADLNAATDGTLWLLRTLPPSATFAAELAAAARDCRAIADALTACSVNTAARLERIEAKAADAWEGGERP